MERPVKRVRCAEPDLTVEWNTLANNPELRGIQQSQCQLAYLQAQLAATESLYAAYEEELNALRGQLVDVKRSHRRDGQPLWKDPAVVLPELPSGGVSRGDDDLVTFSDIEEEVLLQPDDETAQQQQQQPPEAKAPQEQSLELAALRPEAHEAPDGQVSGGTGGAAPPASAGAGASGASAVGGGGAVGAGPNGTGVGKAAAAGAAAGPGPGSGRLAELEVVCSAVAAEDMEAQGALACLAGRAARYYLRSTLVCLGRATESKGEVDVDLGAEEEEAAGRRRGAGATAAGPGEVAAGAAPATADGSAAAPPSSGPEGSGQGPEGATCAAAAPAGRGGAGSHRVSRRAAMIRLGPDGQFRLLNTGRQAVVVNDMEVPPHRATTLPHLSLLRVADVSLLFMANPAAVARCVRRSAALVL